MRLPASVMGTRIGTIGSSYGGIIYPSTVEASAEIGSVLGFKILGMLSMVSVIFLLKGVGHVANVKNKAEILHLSGTLSYDDIYGNGYETQFRYIWEQEIVNVDFKKIDTSHWQKTADGNRAT